MTIAKQNGYNALTKTQLRRVELYSQGFTYEQIAEQEGVQQSALSLSLTRARRKLGIDTTRELCELLEMDCVGHGPANQYTKKETVMNLIRFFVSLAGIPVLAFCCLTIWVLALPAGQAKELTAPELSRLAGWAIWGEVLS